MYVYIVDPDGGIHEQRKLLDLQAAGNIDYKVFPQLKPQPPLDESAWTTVVSYPILKLISLEKIYNYVGSNAGRKTIETTEAKSAKPGAVRSLTLGYRLHAAGHVLSVMYNPGPVDVHTAFFRALVRPAMKSSEEYQVMVRVTNSGPIISTKCSCKAGWVCCKHTTATLHCLEALGRGFTPASAVAPTSLPCQWRKPSISVKPKVLAASDMDISKLTVGRHHRRDKLSILCNRKPAFIKPTSQIKGVRSRSCQTAVTLDRQLSQTNQRVRSY